MEASNWVQSCPASSLIIQMMGQSIPLADRELGAVAGVHRGCAAIQGSLGRLEKWVAGTSWSSGRRSAKFCGPEEEEAPVFPGD